MSIYNPPFNPNVNQDNDRFIPSRKRRHDPSTYFELESLEAEISQSKLAYKRALMTTIFGETHSQPILKISSSLPSSRDLSLIRTPKRKNPVVVFIRDAIPPRAGLYKYPLTTDISRLYYLQNEALYAQNPVDCSVQQFSTVTSYCSVTTVPHTNCILLGNEEGLVTLKDKDSFVTIKNTIFDLGEQICVMKPISTDVTYITSGGGIFGAYDLRTKRPAFRKQLQKLPITGLSTNHNNLVAIGYENAPWAIYDVRVLESPLFTASDKTTFGRNVAFCPRNSDLIASANDKTVRIWQLSRPAQNIHAFNAKAIVTTLDWASTSQSEIQLTMGEDSSSLEYWTFPTEARPWSCTDRIQELTTIPSPTILHTKAQFDPKLTIYVGLGMIAGVKDSVKNIQRTAVRTSQLTSSFSLR